MSARARNRRGAERTLLLATLLALGAAVSGCSYDDTPMALKVIDGEIDRKLYAKTRLAAAAHVVWSLTPAREQERLWRRQTHAVDEFKQRCDAASA